VRLMNERPADADDLPRTFEREWPEFLNELRVALPGVQLLFGFLLAAPFTAQFHAVTGLVQDVYLVCFLATAAACIFLIAPSVYHRLHWRREVRDKEQMLRTCNRLAIIGVVLLAVAMTTAVFVVTSIIATPTRAFIVSSVAGLLIAGLWFALPIARRRVQRKN
jgi:archaellum biogenesis protein FlaJ (TadC family)